MKASTLPETILARREEILRLAEQYSARNVCVFGSMARGRATTASDLDLLVEFEPGRSLLDQSGLILDLEDFLQMKVDVVSEKGLYHMLRDRILSEAVPL